MKIKELIKLHDRNLLRLYMENQGIKNLTDKELVLAYELCKSTGYTLLTTDLENGLLYKVDEFLAKDDEFILQCDTYHGDDYSCETAESFLDLMLKYTGELCNDSYSNRSINSEEPEAYTWKHYFEIYNTLLDFKNKIKESYNKYKYTLEIVTLDHATRKLETSKNIFNSKIDCCDSVYKLINDFINLHGQVKIQDLTGNYNLSEKSELDRFLLEIKENNFISIICNEILLNINIKTEMIAENYYIQIDDFKHGEYTRHQALYHFDSKIKAIKKFNELVRPYKNKYPKDKIGLDDSLYESNGEDTMIYELFIGDTLHFGCYLGLTDNNKPFLR